MLDIAYKYSDQIGELMMETWYDEKYKFYYSSNQRSPFLLNAELTNCRSFAVIDKSDHKVIGFIDYWFEGETNSVSGLTAINFTNKKMLFGRDLCQLIDDIFCKYNFNRFEFSVIRGNPIESSYDRMVQNYGGRIIGTRTQIVKLIDGALYDDKLYEIMRNDYLKAKNTKKEKRETSYEISTSLVNIVELKYYMDIYFNLSDADLVRIYHSLSSAQKEIDLADSHLGAYGAFIPWSSTARKDISTRVAAIREVGRARRIDLAVLENPED